MRCTQNNGELAGISLPKLATVGGVLTIEVSALLSLDRLASGATSPPLFPLCPLCPLCSLLQNNRLLRNVSLPLLFRLTTDMQITVRTWTRLLACLLACVASSCSLAFFSHHSQLQLRPDELCFFSVPVRWSVSSCCALRRTCLS
jgi:hypothetical protein